MLHYNGHGTKILKGHKSLRRKAGMWSCADGELLAIEKYVKVID